jgi:SM-20-related protein
VIVECPHLVMENFLSDADLGELRSFAGARSGTMREATVFKPGATERQLDTEIRRSRVDFDLEPVWPMFDDTLGGLLPILRSELGVDRFPLGKIERQMTVHGDGGLFTRHADEGHPATDGSRVLTFVYYFHADPEAFDGGNLRLFSQREVDGRMEVTDEYIEITPSPNSIVFFPADWHHEVTPLRALGDPETAERWTINGWFCAGDLGRPRSPTVTSPVRNLLARRVVPAVGAGFSLRPTPDAVDRLLCARWELGRSEMVDEGLDETYGVGGARGFVRIDPLGSDLLARLRPLHEAWAGCELVESGSYGLRVFRRGQGIAMHVDRMATHVVSSMLFIDIDGESTFPLTLDHEDRRHTVVPRTGQMLLYEGARIPHGHLAPLEGEHAVVLLLHYRPTDWTFEDDDVTRRGLQHGLIDSVGGVTDLAWSGEETIR